MYIGSSVYISVYLKFKTLVCLLKSTLAGTETNIRQTPNDGIWYQKRP